MQICVFLGSHLGQLEQYGEDARKLGRYLASRDIGIVFGGASIGLMGELARAAISAGGTVTGVIPRQIAHVEIPESSVTELIYVDTLEERENIMFNRSDAFIALPGGFGTLEELFTVIVWNMLGYHNKAVGILDSGGYYASFRTMLDYQVEQGFVRKKWVDRLIVNDHIESLIADIIDESHRLQTI